MEENGTSFPENYQLIALIERDRNFLKKGDRHVKLGALEHILWFSVMYLSFFFFLVCITHCNNKLYLPSFSTYLKLSDLDINSNITHLMNVIYLSLKSVRQAIYTLFAKK